MSWNGTKRGDRKGMWMARARFAALAMAILFSGAGQLASAQPAEDPNWPCVQRKVPEISPGMVWAGPPIEKALTSWQDDPAVASLARELASRRMPMEDAKASIKRFAEAAGADKGDKLTKLFAGILETINHDRASIISGIQRYTTRQRSLAEKIERQSEQLAALPVEEGSTEEGVTSEREDLLEVQNWDIRIFEEREHALTYVCEQPVLLEQRAFALGREIMTYLD